MEEELPFNRRDLLNERPPVETGSGRGSHLSLLIEKKTQRDHKQQSEQNTNCKREKTSVNDMQW